MADKMVFTKKDLVEILSVKDSPEEAEARAKSVLELKNKIAGRKADTKGYGMKSPWLFTKIMVVPTHSSPEECFGEISSTADGGCSWGRSWAGRTGKHSGKSFVNKQDYDAEMAKRLQGGTNKKPLITIKEPSKPLIDQRLIELERWSEDLDLPTDYQRVVVDRRLVWVKT